MRKRYLGSGATAEQYARLAAQRLEQRRAEREALSAEQTQATAADAALREAHVLVDLLLQAAPGPAARVIRTFAASCESPNSAPSPRGGT